MKNNLNKMFEKFEPKLEETSQTISNRIDNIIWQIKDLSSSVEISNGKPNDLKSYLTQKLTNSTKSFKEEFYDSVTNSAKNCADIGDKKGWWEKMCSTFSNSRYLNNIIDLLIENFLIKTTNTNAIVKKAINENLNKTEYYLNSIIESFSVDFEQVESEKWVEIQNKYKNKKKDIYNLVLK